MGGRAWTEEDLNKLDEMIGTYPVKTIAAILGRSFNSVNCKLNRLGYQGFAKSTDMLTVNSVVKMLDIDSKTVNYWNRIGLKIIKKGRYRLIKQESLIEFLKEHKDLFDSTRGDMYLFESYEWFKEKKMRDIANTTKCGSWTTLEEKRLLMYRERGFTYNRCAKELNRTEASIKCKLNYLKYKEMVNEK